MSWKRCSVSRSEFFSTFMTADELTSVLRRARGRIGRLARKGGQDAMREENSIVFTYKQMPGFAELRAAVELALAQLHGPAVRPATLPRDPAERLRELSELHAAGLISEQEFAAKRAEILRQI